MAKRKKKQPEVRLTLRLPRDVHRALVRAAARQERPLNGQVIQYLRYCLIYEKELEGEVQLELLR